MREKNTPFLETSHLSRMVQSSYIVHDISIVVQRGEILAIAGPSGSGKTSFLRLLNRLDEPTQGTVFLQGKNYQDIPPQQLRQQVGMVLQTPFFFPGTVAENMRFGPHQRGQEVHQDIIDGLLQQVGLAGYAERDVQHLSGGEAQRVSLIRTLINEPLIVLLDEPTSALDEASVQIIEQLIVHAKQHKGITCLMITHNFEQATRLADRIMIIEEGRLKTISTVKEIGHAQ